MAKPQSRNEIKWFPFQWKWGKSACTLWKNLAHTHSFSYEALYCTYIYIHIYLSILSITNVVLCPLLSLSLLRLSLSIFSPFVFLLCRCLAVAPLIGPASRFCILSSNIMCPVHFWPCLGDVEEGNVGNNSHPSDGAARNNKADSQDDREGSRGPSSDAPIKEEKSHNKEKSVLQAKLTKLAIQIGYAGNGGFNQLCSILVRKGYWRNCMFLRFHYRHLDRHHPDCYLLHQDIRLRGPAVEERILQQLCQVLDYRCDRFGRGRPWRSPSGCDSLSGLLGQSKQFTPLALLFYK